jgi:hypothetical protein
MALPIISARKYLIAINNTCEMELVNVFFISNFMIRNGDEITFPSRRIDLGQICSISNHKS